MTVLHVATAVFIVGPMAILPMTGLRSLRSGNAAQVRTLARSTGIFTWLSLLTFVFGFGVMGMADPKFNLSFTTPWILWSIILYAIAFLLTIFVVVPRMTAAAEGAAEGAKPANYGIIAATSGLSALLLLAVVVLMIWKP
ncbi:DUF2269 family protein [Microbacterium sp. SYP-A9085]|uniref:DUF2269 family protein n=1 Tax=Microbacterium sp. SYP-A9085 TaxID=2664454 RepID=UPI0020A68DA0|nr:DUF2269 family protein [Microbacterium sp. SYP-A9085]